MVADKEGTDTAQKQRAGGGRRTADSYRTFARGGRSERRDLYEHLVTNTLPPSKEEWGAAYIRTPSPWQTYLLDRFSTPALSCPSKGRGTASQTVDYDRFEIEMSEIELESQESRPIRRGWPTFVWRGGRGDCAYVPLLCRASTANASPSASSSSDPKKGRASVISPGTFNCVVLSCVLPNPIRPIV